ncbi:MAG: 50S ribosomal protein L15 [Legionellaceae bacterium]|nr:50S ribosomal protein L15 [Legionellaceae bacterium]
MKLNTLSPDEGSRKNRRRVGRGIGSGFGKTCGGGHKGQKSRSGGYHKINFEGGQMPIQRRLPKLGFTSRVSRTVDQVTLYEIAKLGSEVTIDLNALKAAGIVGQAISSVKVILSGEIEIAVKLKGLRVTKGAREKIESLGGSIEA